MRQGQARGVRTGEVVGRVTSELQGGARGEDEGLGDDVILESNREVKHLNRAFVVRLTNRCSPWRS